MQYVKVYVEVSARFLREGGVRPEAVVWTDGARYQIDRVRFVERSPSRAGSLMPLRYTVLIGGREKFLYFEPEKMRWFVEVGND